MYGQNGVDIFGNKIRLWKFNISRYVQNVLTKKEPLHNFRLITHRILNEYFRADNNTNTGNYSLLAIPLNSSFALGRVRVGGGNHSTQKMRLRLIYSKI